MSICLMQCSDSNVDDDDDNDMITIDISSINSG